MSIPRIQSMSFHGNEFNQIKTGKPNIPDFNLMYTRYVGIDFVEARKSASVRKK